MKRGPYKGSFLWNLERLPEEQVLEIIRTSKSIRETCIKLNLRLAGSSYPAFKIFLEMRGIELKHFLGKGANRGPKHVGGPKKLTPEQIFAIKKDISGWKLKRALIETGITEECQICKTGIIWNEKKLVLHLDHVDGDATNNNKENLRFLCPNCHSQTDTWGFKKARRSTRKRYVDRRLT